MCVNMYDVCERERGCIFLVCPFEVLAVEVQYGGFPTRLVYIDYLSL